jgi:hypothetical protein
MIKPSFQINHRELNEEDLAVQKKVNAERTARLAEEFQ